MEIPEADKDKSIYLPSVTDSQTAAKKLIIEKLNILEKEQSITKHPPTQIIKMTRPKSQKTKKPLTCEKRCQIVFVSAEVAPWSKTGGLGDVAGSLPVALAERGHRVMVISPK